MGLGVSCGMIWDWDKWLTWGLGWVVGFAVLYIMKSCLCCKLVCHGCASTILYCT